MTNTTVRWPQLHIALVKTVAAMLAAVLPLQTHAQSTSDQLTSRTVIGGNIKQHADAVLAIMTYTTVPDVTTSSLSINNGTTGNPGFGQTQLGGGFTLSRTFPL